MQFNTVTAKLDSGASKHYVRPNDIKCLKDIIPVQSSLVGLPNNKFSEINRIGTLTLNPDLSHAAQTGHILNDLKSSTLLSAGQLCDDDCTVILKKHEAIVQKNNKTLLQGPRNYRDNLWDIEIPITKLPINTTQLVNAIIRKDKSKKELADYLYESCLSPPLSTFQQAILRNNFITWGWMIHI